MFFDDDNMGVGSDVSTEETPATEDHNMPADDAASDSGESHEEAPADHEAAM